MDWWKRFLKRLKCCPNCGFWVACDKCSEEFDRIDQELKEKGF